MKLVKECWLVLLDAFNALTGTPTDGSQQSLGFPGWPGPGHGSPVPHVPIENGVPIKKPINKPINKPIKKNPLVFQPPSHGEFGASDFKCDYTAMGKDWFPCSSETDRGCWLRGPAGTRRFDIDTDYENEAPKGVTRKVLLSNSRCHYHEG